MSTIDEEAQEAEVLRRQSVKLVEHAAKRKVKAESEFRSALRLAHLHGASLRELEAAAEPAGVSHMWIKRLLDREPDEVS